MSQFPPECLYEIFDHLEEEKFALYSCLLVNRLWCGVSVRILWREIWNYKTLIACLPSEILQKNGITMSTPTFNYVSFCKILSIHEISYMLKQIPNVVVQEIYKLLMSQTSLKTIDYSYCPYTSPNQTVNFTMFNGADRCLKELTELHCHSDIDPNFFHNLRNICHNIQTLNITFDDEENVSTGLIDLVSNQNDLKYLSIAEYYHHDNMSSVLENLPNTLVKLVLEGDYIPMSFISFNFVNLQELAISLYSEDSFDHFTILESAIFPQLEIFKISRACLSCKILVPFIENNGKNLKEFYIGDSEENCDNSLNLAIAKFCPELQKLSTGFQNHELETLGLIFNNCQHLQSIRLLCGGIFLSEKEALEAFLKYSHKNVHELILYHNYELRSELIPEELDGLLNPFFLSCGNQKSFSFIIVRRGVSKSDFTTDENLKITMDKYIKSGGIKEFKVISFDRCYDFDCIFDHK